jgi:hypothetical protein
MSLTIFSDIPRSVLALLLDGVGKPSSMSPRLLMGDPGTIGPAEKAELYAGGFIALPDKTKVSLTPQFVKVARVLLNPHTNLNIRIWGNDAICGETNIQFPRDIMSGNGVIFNQIGRMYRISAFVDDSTVVKMVGQAVPEPTEQDLQFEFKAHLDNPVVAILFAVVDLARAQAEKRPSPILNMVFNTTDVYTYMYNRWSLTGFKDLITYVAAVGVMPESPSLTDTVDGLRVLAQAGLLKEIRKDNYSLTRAIEPLARLMIGQPSGLQWQRVCLMDNGDQLISNRTFLFGDKSLMLCLAPTVKGRMFISRVKRQEITDYLADEVMATLASVAAAPASKVSPVAKAVASKPQSAPPVAPQAPKKLEPQVAAVVPPQPTAVTCGNCGTPVASGKKFCSKCGTPVGTPAAAVCANCKSPLKPGIKFCGKCGAAVGQQPVKPAAPACPNCGSPVKPGVKFCNSCGTKLSS